MSTQSFFVLGFSGKIGSGKDYVSKHIFAPMLPKQVKILFLAFGDALKLDCALKHSISYEKLYVQKDSKTRKLLQEHGDELRNRSGSGVFVNYMELLIRLHHDRNNITCFILTDVRYPKEFELIKKFKGYVFRMVAPQRTLDKMKAEGSLQFAKHKSETALDQAKFDAHIYNNLNDNPQECCVDIFIRKNLNERLTKICLNPKC